MALNEPLDITIIGRDVCVNVSHKFNPLTPKNDQHLISPYNITA